MHAAHAAPCFGKLGHFLVSADRVGHIWGIGRYDLPRGISEHMLLCSSMLSTNLLDIKAPPGALGVSMYSILRQHSTFFTSCFHA